MTVESLALESHIFNAHVSEPKPFAKAGSGITFDVETTTGTHERVIDAITGAAVGSLGWGDKDVPKMFQNALEKHTYSFPANIINEEAEKLSKFYIDNSPEGVFCSALWTCSGSESNENAMKIVRQYQKERGKPRKIKVITRECSYHGFTIGSMSMGNNIISDQFIEFQNSDIFLKMPRCFPYKDMKEGETEDQYAARLLDVLEKMILDNDPETVSCVCVETLPGSSIGTAPPPKSYLKGLRDLCNKYDIVFMLDEVMCGTGRSNPNSGLNCWENFLDPEDGPDIQTVGKTLGSGYVTIAGVLVGPKIMKSYMSGSGYIIGAQTYHTHGLNCSVALQIQEKIKSLELTKNIWEKGNSLGAKLTDALIDEDIVGDVRGIGGFWTIEFVKDKSTKTNFSPDLKVATRFGQIALKHGLSVMALTCSSSKRGESWDIAMFAPSYIITDDDVDEMVARTLKSVKTLSKELIVEGSF
ncbi:adenosylmethionine-8-amino-7-oxononanoate aminotransferase [Monosporozyma unispora]